MDTGRPVWAEIDLGAIRNNLAAMKNLLRPDARLCAVIKADGYGHGAVPVAREALAAGASYLAVAVLDEALHLREAGFTCPILVLGYTPPEQARLAAGAGLTQTIHLLEQAEALDAAGRAAGRTVKVHLKVETGMGRLGLPPDEIGLFAARVAQFANLEIEGIFTHFAQAGSRDKAYTTRQLTEFQRALHRVRDQGLRIPLRHAANSAGLFDHPEAHFSMVRVGIALYGLWPSEEVRHTITLTPAMRLKARVAQVKTVAPGSAISYDGIYVTPARAAIATLPLGYADGWVRGLSGKAEVIIHGRRAPLVGRICMDQCMADVTGLTVQAGDEVLLFGGPELPVEEVARRLDTINYEIVCLVGKRVPRRYLNAS